MFSSPTLYEGNPSACCYFSSPGNSLAFFSLESEEEVVEPDTKVTDAEPCTKISGPKSLELTKPHNNSYHEPPDLNWPVCQLQFNKIPTLFSTLLHPNQSPDTTLPAGILS